MPNFEFITRSIAEKRENTYFDKRPIQNIRDTLKVCVEVRAGGTAYTASDAQ